MKTSGTVTITCGLMAAVICSSTVSFAQTMKILADDSTYSFSLSEVERISFITDDELPLYNLRFSAEETGQWVEAEGGYREFIRGDELEPYFGNKAAEYLSHGFVGGVYQNLLLSGADIAVRIIASDFQDSSSAGRFYRYITGTIDDTALVPVEGFDAAAAVIDTAVSSGCILYSRIQGYFLEIHVDGNGTSSGEMLTAVSYFLPKCYEKLNVDLYSFIGK